MKIDFIKMGPVPSEYYPIPSTSFIPEWYKKTASYDGDSGKKPDLKGKSPATIKRCMPVFDAITAGYLITSWCDIYVSQVMNEEGEVAPWYSWTVGEPITFHPLHQAPNHPNRNGMPAYPKWISPWGIKTPPGYSCFFVQPLHRESVFSILPGIVDTDTYIAPVNFPFVLNDVTFEGLIPAGTPIAQVIPFKRDEWTATFEDPSLVSIAEETNLSLRSKFFDAYKTKFRQPKEYK
jgi:hypothetical protein